MWAECFVRWQIDAFEFDHAGFSIRVLHQQIDPQHFEQVRFWSTRKQSTADRCRHCDYNLTGSPGPACPECGKPVRILESPTD